MSTTAVADVHNGTDTASSPNAITSDPWTDPNLRSQRDALINTLRGYGRVAVAYSGGIDSTVVAQAAREASTSQSPITCRTPASVGRRVGP